MKLVDVNVLLYARNEAAEHHQASVRWLDNALNGREPVGLPWVSTLGFLRLSTRIGIFPRPLGVDEAVALVRSWRDAPAATSVEPTSRHLDVLAGILAEVGAGGNLVSDAHLAALAVEHHATVVTFDNDFDRFPGVRWERPSP